MSKTLYALTAAYLVALLLSLAGNTQALPEYSVRYGQNCQLCHIGVTGAGQRNSYGSQLVSYFDLPSKTARYSQLDSLNHSISEKLHYGFDFRSLFYTSENLVSNQSANSFVTMQGDLYLTATPTPRIALLFTQSMHDGFEGFAQYRNVQGGTWARVGRFQPAYGWQYDNHRIFTRQFLGFGGTAGNARGEDGIEFGLNREWWDLSASLTNGQNASTVDIDEGKAGTLRLSTRFGHKNKATLGTNVRYEEYNTANVSPFKLLYSGLFYGVHAGAFTYLGEIDLIHADRMKRFVASNQLIWTIQRGWHLVAGYDSYDPDLDLGGEFYQQGRLGLKWIPVGYLALEPFIEYNKATESESVTGTLQFHIWY